MAETVTKRRRKTPRQPERRQNGPRVLVHPKILLRSRWLWPILEAGRAGYIVPLWSPQVIAEATRVAHREWLQRNGAGIVDLDLRVLDDQMRHWFTIVSEIFEVVEDRQSYADQWVDPPPTRDVPLWTAAVNGHADFVITPNTTAAPAADDRGAQVYKGVIFMHPDLFAKFLEVLTDLWASRGLMTLDAAAELAPMVAADELGSQHTSDSNEDVSPHLRASIEEILERADANREVPEEERGQR